MAKNVDVVGIGSCTVDYFAIVPRLLGPEEKINATRMEIHAGGVTANNLTQVARLGASTPRSVIRPVTRRAGVTSKA